MDAASQIGPSIHIRGEVTAQEPLTIAGHLDGSVRVTGHALTISQGGTINATMTADTIVVCGAVNGRLEATTRIVVRETATIEGDLVAPIISFTDGATVKGRIETAARSASALSLAS